MIFQINVETFSTIRVEAESEEALREMIENNEIPDDAWETLNIFEENIVAESIKLGGYNEKTYTVRHKNSSFSNRG